MGHFHGLLLELYKTPPMNTAHWLPEGRSSNKPPERLGTLSELQQWFLGPDCWPCAFCAWSKVWYIFLTSFVCSWLIMTWCNSCFWFHFDHWAILLILLPMSTDRRYPINSCFKQKSMTRGLCMAYFTWVWAYQVSEVTFNFVVFIFILWIATRRL